MNIWHMFFGAAPAICCLQHQLYQLRFLAWLHKEPAFGSVEQANVFLLWFFSTLVRPWLPGCVLQKLLSDAMLHASHVWGAIFIAFTSTNNVDAFRLMDHKCQEAPRLNPVVAWDAFPRHRQIFFQFFCLVAMDGSLWERPSRHGLQHLVGRRFILKQMRGCCATAQMAQRMLSGALSCTARFADAVQGCTLHIPPGPDMSQLCILNTLSCPPVAV